MRRDGAGRRARRAGAGGGVHDWFELSSRSPAQVRDDLVVHAWEMNDAVQAFWADVGFLFVNVVMSVQVIPLGDSVVLAMQAIPLQAVQTLVYVTSVQFARAGAVVLLDGSVAETCVQLVGRAFAKTAIDADTRVQFVGLMLLGEFDASAMLSTVAGVLFNGHVVHWARAVRGA